MSDDGIDGMTAAERARPRMTKAQRAAMGKAKAAKSAWQPVSAETRELTERLRIQEGREPW